MLRRWKAPEEANLVKDSGWDIADELPPNWTPEPLRRAWRAILPGHRPAVGPSPSDGDPARGGPGVRKKPVDFRPGLEPND